MASSRSTAELLAEIDGNQLPPEGSAPEPKERQTRKPPERQTLEVQPEPEPQPSGPTPEEALEQATARIRELEADQERTHERAARAERERDDARATGATAEARAVAAHEASLNAAIDAAKAAVQKARQQVKTAGEANDWEGVSAAVDEQATASARLASLNVDKQRFDAWKEQRKEQPATGGQPEPRRAGPSQEAQRWIDHCRDAGLELSLDENGAPLNDFSDAAVTAHNRAIRAGHSVGSRDYVRFVDSQVRKEYPDLPALYQVPVQRQQARVPASSMAAAPSRAGGIGSGTQRGSRVLTAREVATEYGLSEDEVRQGAKIAGMKESEYLAEQTRIIADRRAGRGTGLLSTGDITMVS